MTKFRCITQEKLLQRVVRALPEINPAYVQKRLTEACKAEIEVSEVAGWIMAFENDLYGREGGYLR